MAAFFPAALFDAIIALTNLRESNHLDFLNQRDVSHIPRHQRKTPDPGSDSNDSITKITSSLMVIFIVAEFCQSSASVVSHTRSNPSMAS